MFCSECGKNIPDGSKVCPYCGVRIAEAEEQPIVGVQPIQEVQPVMPVQPMAVPAVDNSAFNVAKTSSMKNKMPLIIGAAAVLVIVAVVLICVLAGGAGSTGISFVTENSDLTTYTVDDVVYLFNGTTLVDEIEGVYLFNGTTPVDEIEKRRSPMLSENGSKMVIIDKSDTLFMYDGSKVTEIADYVLDYNISDDGSAILFRDEDKIYLYANGKEDSIADVEDYYACDVISPNGSIVMYASCELSEEEQTELEWYGSDHFAKDAECHVYRNGKDEKLGKYLPLAVSDDGSIAFVQKGNKLGYITNLQNEFKSIDSEFSSYNFNADNTAVLYTSNNKTYYYKKGMEKAVKVDNKSVELVAPKNGRYTSLDTFYGTVGSDFCKFTLNGDEFEQKKLVGSVYNLEISADGTSALYMKKSGSSRRLYKLDLTNPQVKPVTVAKSADTCQYDDNFNHIYYSDYDNEYGEYVLFYSNGMEDFKAAIHDMGDLSRFYVTDDGTCVYLYDSSNDGYETVYSVKCSVKGGKPTEPEGLSEVNSVSIEGDIVFAEYDDEVFVSADGTNFVKTKIEG